MKKFICRVISVILSLLLILAFCCCSFSPENCDHVGEISCKKCGVNYFNELVLAIKNKATSIENGNYTVEAKTENVDCFIKYDSVDNEVLCALAYKNNGKLSTVFLMMMKSAKTTYGWAMSENEKIANGKFKAEDVTGLIFRPEIENNEFSDVEFSSLNDIYESSISFCVDALHSLLWKNKNNVTIFDLGFVNYSPNVSMPETSSSADSADSVTIENAEIYDNYAVLPLCNVIVASGLHLTWLDNDHATFVCNEVEYRISISEKTLTKSNGNENYLTCAPGNTHFVCEVGNGTLMVDDNTVQCLFQTFLDYPVRISIDYDENVIIFEKQ